MALMKVLVSFDDILSFCLVLIVIVLINTMFNCNSFDQYYVDYDKSVLFWYVIVDANAF